MNLTKEILSAAAGIDISDPEKWIDVLNAAMQEFHIDSPVRAAAFLAQVMEESAGLSHLEESFMYRAMTLVRTWPRHFYLPPDAAAGRGNANDFTSKPQKIANLVYANRLGNGSDQSGDGWTYRGRGLIQLTGRSNYTRAATALNLPVDAEPDLLLQPRVAARSAAWFWNSIGANALADINTRDSFIKITQLINGGQIGADARLKLWDRTKKVFADSGLNSRQT